MCADEVPGWELSQTGHSLGYGPYYMFLGADNDDGGSAVARFNSLSVPIGGAMHAKPIHTDRRCRAHWVLSCLG